MKPESARFIAKARKLLTGADTMLGAGLNEDAGRAAYLAAFHGAQGLIFERLGRVLKSHNGVRTEFLRLTKDEPKSDFDLRAFLSQAYNLKALADYETGPSAVVPAARARQAVATAKRFVAHFAAALEQDAKP